MFSSDAVIVTVEPTDFNFHKVIVYVLLKKYAFLKLTEMVNTCFFRVMLSVFKVF